MYGILFSAAFCIVAGLAILCGALKGRKYKWQYSLSRLIVVVISVVASAILASVISNAIIGMVVVMLLDGGVLNNVAGINLGELVNSLESGVLTVKALGSMIVSPLPFLKIGQYKVRKESLELFLKKHEGKDLTDPFHVKELN